MMAFSVVLILFCFFNANSAEFINNFQIDKSWTSVVTRSTITTNNYTDAFNLNSPSCGKSSFVPSSFRIVGGTQAKPGDWRWQGQLMRLGEFICGGSLINSEWVVTAAHCVVEKYSGPSFYSFSFGVIDRLNPESWSELRTVSEIHIHHGYNPNFAFQNDIALFKLSKPVEYSDYINPICIPEDSSSFAGNSAWTTGWGKLSGADPASQYLMQVSVPILNDTGCLESYPMISPKIHICAGALRKTTCQGDSGGPLVIQKDDGRWYLAGITSFGYLGCESDSVKVRTGYYYDWILSTIRYENVENLNSTINSLVVLKNGNLAGGSKDATIKIWDTDTVSLLRTLKGHSLEILSLAVLQNGYLASASMDKTIKIWNTEDGSLIRTLTGHTESVYSLAVLQNGYLASGSFDETIKIWNSDNGTLIRTLSVDNNPTSLAVLHNGYLASGDMDLETFNGTIKIWDTADGSLIRTLTGDSMVVSLAVLQNSFLASSNGDATIKIWNTDDGSLIKTLKGHLNNIKSLAVLKNGYLASAGMDATIKIWNTDDGRLITTLREQTGDVNSLAVLQNGYLASSSNDNSVIIWS